ncbi:HotDog domain-containing protein [Hyaloraphidium curvatum]|nr:HotDog domain-containing protein [Hyaloraphidium curvatum]
MSSFFDKPPPAAPVRPARTITSPDDELDEPKMTPREAGKAMRSGAKETDLSPRSASEGAQMALQTLIEEWLDLEYLDRNLYRSKHLWLPLGARGVFGGQVIGQSLVAMSRTVASTFTVHSLHCYFVMAGDPSIPILYHIDRIRDGVSFCVRRVRASQRDRTIFVASASFQKIVATEVPGSVVLEYQSLMPSVPRPEELPSTHEQMRKALQSDLPKHLHSLLSQRLQEPMPFDFKPVGRGMDFFNSTSAPPKVIPPQQLVWIRARGQLDPDPALHMAVIAHASDHYLVNTALLAHGVNWNSQPRLKMLASLDHAMWFHLQGWNGTTGFRCDDWLLYELQSNRTSANRGLVFGRIWTRDGKLAVTVAQEGVMRVGYDADKRDAAGSDGKPQGAGDGAPPMAKLDAMDAEIPELSAPGPAEPPFPFPPVPDEEGRLEEADAALELEVGLMGMLDELRDEEEAPVKPSL